MHALELKLLVAMRNSACSSTPPSIILKCKELSEMCQNPAYNEYAHKLEKPEKSPEHSLTLNSNQTADDQ